ncbi:DUF1569 domain-containing protein [Leptospira wolffii]|uniref:DUF1569 domain-containing protein n=1 Tax=Leptospira wolffii TaxID=409998 RepID=UPI0010843776|nr:DUF1569 domain-containing protein [Leptospira wolffii]TGK61947.1 DUF1569 domain-containing protein [Leptospira wolffii]TGK68548.1 DUF1569 domain-containing protein [Leptospira wolffii]TGK74669.1 DUF1569 domain-containing protein [Leptospira wolffii]TGL31755.1 DUF1569 domain-containing protein [Leptospira wolffii]
MKPEQLSRKEFLNQSVRLGVLIVGAGTASSLLHSCSNSPAGAKDRGLVFANLDDADEELEKLRKASKILPYGEWSPAQILLHCAQSIRYSIQGYPENKPAIFQNTVGRLAFWNFERKGRMSHDLNAPIPGADILKPSATLEEGIFELRKAFEAFIEHRGEFAPHFAYGALSKKEYESAHAMHIANHLTYLDYSF